MGRHRKKKVTTEWLLKYREALLHAIIDWEVNGMMYCACINGWGINENKIVFSLEPDSLCHFVDDEWYLLSSARRTISFSLKSISLCISGDQMFLRDTNHSNTGDDCQYTINFQTESADNTAPPSPPQ